MLAIWSSVMRSWYFSCVRLKDAMHERIEALMGIGSLTRGASVSASSDGINFGTVYGNASTLEVSYCKQS